MTTKTKPTEPTSETSDIEAARERVVEAERRVEALKIEEERLKSERAGLGYRNDAEARAVQARITRRAAEMFGRPVYRKETERIGSEASRRLGLGEVAIASEELREAREALAKLERPLPSVGVAQRQLAEAEAELAALRAEEASLPEDTKAAALALDVERQVELQQRSDAMPLLLDTSARKVTRLRLQLLDAQLTEMPNDDPERRTLAERRHQLLRAIVDQDRAAVAAAAPAPVVRSRWQQNNYDVDRRRG